MSMLLRLTIFAVCTTCVGAASAGEFWLRVENAAGMDDPAAVSPPVSAQRPSGEIRNTGPQAADSIEIQLQLGAKFATKTKVGGKSFEVRGQLRPGSQPDRFVLDISVEVATTKSGRLAGTPAGDIVNRNRATTTIEVAPGKPVILGGWRDLSTPGDTVRHARKNDWQILSMTLEKTDGDQ